MKRTISILLLSVTLLLTACGAIDPLITTSTQPTSSVIISELTTDEIATSENSKNEDDPSESILPTTSQAVEPTVTPTPTPTPSTPTIDPVEPSVEMPELYAAEVFVYDLDDKEFIYLKKNAETIIPASTTKLLTILYAKTLLSLDTPIKPGNELELLQEHSSIAFIRSHHVLTVEQLIEGMMLPSGNDAALVLAAAGGYVVDPDAVDGKAAVAAFMDGMNAYAETIGLQNSHFMNPEGYPVEGHYSCLYDMAIIGKLAYEDETIRKYSSLPEDDVKYYSGHLITWKNSNHCIKKDSQYYIPEANGLKTGVAEENYTCLMLSLVIGGNDYIVGIFAAPGDYKRFVDALTIAQWLRDIS